MGILVTRKDFKSLRKIDSLNNTYFSREKDYIPKTIRSEAKILQKPVWNKMRNIKYQLEINPYFNERFDIKISRPNKQSTKTVKGQIRKLVWISLANLSELGKVKHTKLKHVHVPQLQISFQPHRFIVASIWLEGKNCKQIYREKFLEYLKNHKIDKRYRIEIYNKNTGQKEFDDSFNKLNHTDYDRFLNKKNFSISLNLTWKSEEIIKLNNDLYSLIVSELQLLNEKIIIPCFGFVQKSKKSIKKQSEKVKRKARGKFQIKSSLRKGTEPIMVSKKHLEIQNTLYDLFNDNIKGSEKVVKLEKDFVDIRVEDMSNKSIILYEIKTDKSALNCLKHGLGQLLFYNLINSKDGWKNIEMVIVGLHKMNREAKEFVKSIKEYLYDNKFRYQKFDYAKRVLLSERKS